MRGFWTKRDMRWALICPFGKGPVHGSSISLPGLSTSILRRIERRLLDFMDQLEALWSTFELVMYR